MKRTLAPLAAVGVLAGSLLAAAPATAAPTATPAAAPASDPPFVASTAHAYGHFEIHTRHGGSCTTGRVDFDVSFWHKWSTGRVTRIEATNNTTRGIVFDDLYVTRRTGSRAETFGAVLGADIAPGRTQFMGSQGKTHKYTFYVHARGHATTRKGCGGAGTAKIEF
jgi:hypothetical protein